MTHRLCVSLAIFVFFGCETPVEPDAGSTGEDAGSADAGGSDAGPVCAADGECDDGQFCNGPERCVDAACQAGEPPCDLTLQTCDEDADACEDIDCSMPDGDGDGHRAMACGGGDCNDGDPSINPGVMEICDAANVDEDCNPDTYGFRDADMDGEPDARCCNGELCGTDCDDMRPGVNPTVPEVCGNALDDDCDGMMDEGLLVAGYPDPDGDGWGEEGAAMIMACPGAPMFSTMDGDCDETDGAVNPGATETCDGEDNDCDGTADDGLPTMLCYEDMDGDGYGVTGVTSMRCSCGSGWAVMPGDCLDNPANPDAHDANPGASWNSGGYCPTGTCTIGVPPWTADWNCDGSSDRRWEGDLGFCPLCVGSRPESRVWEDGTVPECGQTGWMLLCHSDCTETRVMQAQECR